MAYHILFLLIFLSTAFKNYGIENSIGISLLNHEQEIVEKVSALTGSVDDAEVFEKIKPFLIPREHPCYESLQMIFSQKGVLSSVQNLERAGFKIICQRMTRGLIVVKHVLLKGYLLKLFVDATHKSLCWDCWCKRAKGARHIQEAIDTNIEYKKYLKVPKKLIYILPKEMRGNPSPGKKIRESVMLIEDMQIYDEKTSQNLYKSIMSYAAIDALYAVLRKSRLSDSHIGNLPLSYDLRIAFIDTESTSGLVHYDWMTQWFSPSKQRYWEALVEQGARENSNGH